MFRFATPQFIGDLLAHVVVALSFMALSYTAKNYYVFVEVVQPSVEALAPVSAGKLAEAISLHLPSSEQGNYARALVQAQVSESRILHEAWLSQTKAQVTSLRIQLVAWTTVWLVSLGLVILQIRRRASAA